MQKEPQGLRLQSLFSSLLNPDCELRWVSQSKEKSLAGLFNNRPTEILKRKKESKREKDRKKKRRKKKKLGPTYQCCLCERAVGPWRWCGPSWDRRLTDRPGRRSPEGFHLQRSRWSGPPPREEPAPLTYPDATCAEGQDGGRTDAYNHKDENLHVCRAVLQVSITALSVWWRGTYRKVQELV